MSRAILISLSIANGRKPFFHPPFGQHLRIRPIHLDILMRLGFTILAQMEGIESAQIGVDTLASKTFGVDFNGGALGNNLAHALFGGNTTLRLLDTIGIGFGAAPDALGNFRLILFAGFGKFCRSSFGLLTLDGRLFQTPLGSKPGFRRQARLTFQLLPAARFERCQLFCCNALAGESFCRTLKRHELPSLDQCLRARLLLIPVCIGRNGIDFLIRLDQLVFPPVVNVE